MEAAKGAASDQGFATTAMTEDEVLAEVRASHALLEGHFKLSSGRHSAHYLQCARVLMSPERAGALARALVQKIPRELRSRVDKVVSPAMGGLIIGHEVARALEVDAMFVERPSGTFEFRRAAGEVLLHDPLQVVDVVQEHLVEVPDARAFGCVPTGPDGRVTGFVEKSDDPVTNQINAGCYVFRRRVLDEIPAGRVVSVERETFPELVAAGRLVVGYVDTAYWRDVGTPQALVAASRDLVLGVATIVFTIWVFTLDRKVTSQFEGRRWTLPAQVYAQPTELYVGSAFSADLLEQELQRLGYQRVAQPKNPGSYSRRGNRIDLVNRRFRFWDAMQEPQLLSVTARGNAIEDMRNGRNEEVPIFRLDPLLIGSIFPIHGEDRGMTARHAAGSPTAASWSSSTRTNVAPSASRQRRFGIATISGGLHA